MAVKMESNQVEVDMVPLIDIISLLLMFLVMVGDMEKNSASVKMKLPRVSEAKTDKQVNTKNRIVVQMKYDKTDGKYWAIVDNQKYTIEEHGNNGTLIKYLTEQITKKVAGGDVTVDALGGYNMPVKLRIPADAPMREAERLVMSMAQAKLVNVHYACEELSAAAAK